MNIENLEVAAILHTQTSEINRAIKAVDESMLNKKELALEDGISRVTLVDCDCNMKDELLQAIRVCLVDKKTELMSEIEKL